MGKLRLSSSSTARIGADEQRAIDVPEVEVRLHTHSISPSLPPNALLLRTLATPINPADINQVQGIYPSKPPFTSMLGTSSPSAVAGNEGCFEVQAVGSSLSKSSPLQKGDWVIMSSTNFGTWRTHALATEKDVIKIEDKAGLSPIQVGTVSVNPCTAYRMLRDFETLRPGDWFVQNGANSGVGRAAIQLGREWGLRSINVIRERPDAAATQAMKDELLSLGGTHVVTEAELMSKGFTEQVKEWTSGEGVRLGLNCVGGKPTAALVKCLSDSGHLVTYGAMSKQPVLLPTGALIFKDIKFSGYWVSRWSNANPAAKKATVEEILSLTREGKFRDIPVQELQWNWGTEESVLKDAVQGTLGGFRAGKGVFVYGDT
ncbi:hypothetical protein LZ554_008982 [Drepanopeziza brunnea f. sp. 'monogermtubi']|nr:hypothetical protein LZ554_008982 [Drepanopeziza brunnea f. sp. 'monogermtubi']